MASPSGLAFRLFAAINKNYYGIILLRHFIYKKVLDRHTDTDKMYLEVKDEE